MSEDTAQSARHQKVISVILKHLRADHAKKPNIHFKIDKETGTIAYKPR